MKPKSKHPIASRNFNKRVLIGIPMTGLLRAEWHLAYMGMVVPCNWSQSTFAHVFEPYSPLRFLVADARNLVAQKAVLDDFEWLIFIDHDVILPHDTMVKFNERMIKEDTPVYGGLYFTKSLPAEPLVYRGRGNGYFNKWKLGEKVMVDGMGLGCHLISVRLLKALYEDSETYSIQPGITVRRIFETPSRIEIDPVTGGFINGRGTEDLPFYSRIIEGGYFKKSGWKEYEGKKYPYVCDTSLFCQHIDQNGQRFPSAGEEREFKR